MSKYEEFDARYTIEGLNKYVKQGWELVNAVHATQWGPTLLFMKRPA